MSRKCGFLLVDLMAFKRLLNVKITEWSDGNFRIIMT